MRHLRLYVDVPELPRQQKPTPPPPFASGSVTPRLSVRGRVARLAKQDERFGDSGAAVSARGRSAAETAQEQVEGKRRLRYKFDTGKVVGGEEKEEGVVAASAKTIHAPSSSSARCSSTNSNSKVRRPFSSLVRKSSDKYSQLHADRRELQAKLNKQQFDEHQAAVRHVREANARATRSPSPAELEEVRRAAVAVESARLMHAVADPSSISLDTAAQPNREVASLYAYLFHTSHAKKSPVRADVYGCSSLSDGGGGGGAASLESTTDPAAPFQHRALSPGPTAALASHISSTDPFALNHDQKKRLIQPHHNNEDEQLQEALSPRGVVVHRPSTSPPRSSAGVSPTHSRTPAMAKLLQRAYFGGDGEGEQQQQQARKQQQPRFTRPSSAAETRARNPRLRQSQDLLAAALDLGQSAKFNGRKIFRSSTSGFPAVMTEEERREHAATLRELERRPSTHFMVSIDEAGGPVVTEAIGVAGSRMQVPPPRRPHTARQQRGERNKAVARDDAENENSGRTRHELPGAAAVPQTPNPTVAPYPALSYVSPAPGVFAAGLMPTRSEELVLSNLQEMANPQPLCLVPPGSRGVAVPAEFDNRVPTPRSSKWSKRQ